MYKYFLQNPNTAILTNEEMFTYNLRLLGKLNQSASFHKFSSDVINIHKSLNMDSTSAYLPMVNSMIKRVVESGIVEKIVSDVVDPSDLRRRVKENDKKMNEFVPLSLLHTFSCFFYLVSGWSLSLIVFACEIFLSKYVVLYKVGVTQEFYGYK